MAKFSYNLLKESADIKETPEKLADILTLKTAEVGGIMKTDKDTILDIDILPNRGDLLSHYGLAREVSVLLESKLKEKKIKLKEKKDKNIKDLLSVVVEDKDKCKRYTMRLIEGIKVSASPAWLKERLESMGINSINNVVDATNYTMLNIGQPLHAFDFDKLAGKKNKKKIFVRNSKKGEKIKTLDEQKTSYTLEKDILLITDSEKPLAIAGIKGGVGSEITKTTKNIVLESANFDPVYIRKASQKLNLRSDASIRFSYNIDPNITQQALDHVAELIIELAGGSIVPGIVDEYSQKREVSKIVLKKAHPASLIGINIAEKEITGILTRLGMKISEDGDKWVVIIPTFRPDLKTPEDIIEEIARVYGYDKIPPQPPLSVDYPQHPPSWASGNHIKEYGEMNLWDTAEIIQGSNIFRDNLKNLGMTEIVNYSFINDETKELFKLEKAPKILNPVSHQFGYLRTTLLHNIIQSAKENLRYSNNFQLFEIGRVFLKTDDGVEEKRELGGVYVGNNPFFSLKGILESFLAQLGITDYIFEEGGLRLIFHPGKHALILINDIPVGEMGEINPKIVNQLNIKSKIGISMFRFNLLKLLKEVKEDIEFQVLPKYPSVVRDISVLVDRGIKISQILNEIEGADTLRIVQDVDVFDIFEDEAGGLPPTTRKPLLPKDKKSVAFHLVLRSDDHTLTDKEINEVEKNIKIALEKNLGAEVR